MKIKGKQIFVHEFLRTVKGLSLLYPHFKMHSHYAKQANWIPLDLELDRLFGCFISRLIEMFAFFLGKDNLYTFGLIDKQAYEAICILVTLMMCDSDFQWFSASMPMKMMIRKEYEDNHCKRCEQRQLVTVYKWQCSSK